MKSTNRVPNAIRQTRTAPASETAFSGRVMEDYENVPNEPVMGEYLSVAGFFRRLPFSFHMDEINRFGAKAGAAAEGLHLAYLTQVDRALGPVRVFPIALLERVYEVLAVHQKWPPIVQMEAAALHDARKLDAAGLKSHERMAKHLRNLIELAPNAELQHSAATLVQWIEGEIAAAKAEPEAPTPKVEPQADLRAGAVVA